MKTQSKRFFLSFLAVAALIAVFLFGSAGVTVYAAQSALPGDTLYQVKTTVEQTRISLARDAAARAQLQMEFAERRLVEVSSLISEGRFTDISTATREFEGYVESAIRELETVAKGDPERAAVLTAQIMEALSRYNRALSSMVTSVPDAVKADVLRAIQSSELGSSPVVQTVETEFSGFVTSITSGLWVVGGQAVTIHTQTEVKGDIAVGDFVKVHATLNSAGDLVAREIELSADASTANGNSNDNSNSNDNNGNDDSLNGNANDDNGNDDSLNGNANDDNSNDDSLNGNANDDNSNDDSLNGNANDDNSNDDSGNANGSDDNSNDDNGGNANDDNSNDDSGGSGDDNGSNDNGDDNSGKGGDDSGKGKDD